MTGMTDDVSVKINMKSGSILSDIRQREYNSVNHYRKDIKILRKLVCSKNVKYHSTWTVQSRMPIYYENRMIFMNGYKDCYTVKGMDHTAPILRKYSLPKGRVIEVLWCQFSLLDLSEHKVHCVTLMSDNTLRLLDCEAGNVLRVIHLDPVNKYLHIDWNTPSETFFLKSKLYPKKMLTDRLTSFAVFRIFPVHLITTMDINRCIFGSNITDASLFGNMLYITNSAGDVRLYNLHKELEKMHLKSWDDSPWQSNSIVIAEPPPILFEVRDAKSDFQVCGVPWSFIVPISSSRSCFEVRSVASGKVLRFGRLDFQYDDCIEPDVVYYHPDNSGRILHGCLYNLTVKRIVNEDQLADDYVIRVSDDDRLNGKMAKRTTVTSSGRVVKRAQLSQWGDHCDKILTHCYEDELDILALLRCDAYGRGRVTLHDNQSGRVLKTIHLSHKISDLFEHTLVLDMDILVVLSDDLGPSKNLCHLYSMKCD